MPDIKSGAKIYACDFAKWVDDYNRAPLSASSKPTNTIMSFVSKCNATVCSHLQRSKDSANAFKPRRLIVDQFFAEAELPSAKWKLFKLPPKYWGIIFRFLWILGYSKNVESFKSARYRASQAAYRLAELSEKYQQILLVGHGIMNRLIVRELMKNGWSCSKRPSSKYWGFGVYEKYNN